MTQQDKKPEPVIDTESSEHVDENMSLLIYGNIKIIDPDSGEILVNKRF